MEIYFLWHSWELIPTVSSLMTLHISEHEEHVDPPATSVASQQSTLAGEAKLPTCWPYSPCWPVPAHGNQVPLEGCDWQPGLIWLPAVQPALWGHRRHFGSGGDSRPVRTPEGLSMGDPCSPKFWESKAVFQVRADGCQEALPVVWWWCSSSVPPWAMLCDGDL